MESETSNAEGSSGQETPAEAAARQRKAEMAAARRAAILAQMSAQQKSFIKEHAKLFQETESEAAAAAGSGTILGSSLGGSAMDLSESACASLGADLVPSFPVCLGPEFSVGPLPADQSYTCIVCQEEHRQTGEQPAMVLAAFVQLSTVLRWKNDKEAANVSSTTAEELNPNTWPGLVDAGRRMGTHISSCGHVMHFGCWEQHFESLVGHERRRSYRPRQSASYDVNRREFLCPLCKGLSNAVLPILPNQSSYGARPTGSEAGLGDMNVWLEGLQLMTDASQEIKSSNPDVQPFLDTVGPALLDTKMGAVKSRLFINLLTIRTRPKIATTLKKKASLFAQAVYTVSTLKCKVTVTLIIIYV
jgi:E3 ubiquitin-protein ligase UBR2